MTEIKVIRGDFGYTLNFTLKDSNDNVFDLSTATQLLFRVQNPGLASLKFSSAMSIISATAGTCKYVVEDGDFDEDGDYNAEIQISFGTTKLVTFDDIIVNVGQKVPIT